MAVPTDSAAAMRAWLSGAAGSATSEGASSDAAGGVVVAMGSTSIVGVSVFLGAERSRTLRGGWATGRR